MDVVRFGDGTTLPMIDWLSSELDRIEGREPVARDPRTQESAAPTILQALMIIERSELRFATLPRRNSKSGRAAKRTEYTSSEFAAMLRKKWEFFGKDVHDLDGFMAEIAGTSFKTLRPYRVILRDGSEVELGPWLLGRLEAEGHRPQTKDER